MMEMRNFCNLFFISSSYHMIFFFCFLIISFFFVLFITIIFSFFFFFFSYKPLSVAFTITVIFTLIMATVTMFFTIYIFCLIQQLQPKTCHETIVLHNMNKHLHLNVCKCIKYHEILNQE